MTILYRILSLILELKFHWTLLISFNRFLISMTTEFLSSLMCSCCRCSKVLSDWNQNDPKCGINRIDVFRRNEISYAWQLTALIKHHFYLFVYLILIYIWTPLHLTCPLIQKEKLIVNGPFLDNINPNIISCLRVLSCDQCFYFVRYSVRFLANDFHLFNWIPINNSMSFLRLSPLVHHPYTVEKKKTSRLLPKQNISIIHNTQLFILIIWMPCYFCVCLNVVLIWFFFSFCFDKEQIPSPQLSHLLNCCFWFHQFYFLYFIIPHHVGNHFTAKSHVIVKWNKTKKNRFCLKFRWIFGKIRRRCTHTFFDSLNIFHIRFCKFTFRTRFRQMNGFRSISFPKWMKTYSVDN